MNPVLKEEPILVHSPTRLLVILDLVQTLPSYQQLIDQDAEGPEVDCKVVSLVLDNLWRHVLRCSNK